MSDIVWDQKVQTILDVDSKVLITLLPFLRHALLIRKYYNQMVFQKETMASCSDTVSDHSQDMAL